METSGAMSAAVYVAALWKIGAPPGKRMRDSHCIVDRALRDIHPQMHSVVWPEFTFTKENLGTRCREWPEISQYLEMIGLAERDGSTFLTLEVKASDDSINQLLYEIGLSRSECAEVATAFYDSIVKYERELLQ